MCLKYVKHSSITSYYHVFFCFLRLTRVLSVLPLQNIIFVTTKITRVIQHYLILILHEKVFMSHVLFEFPLETVFKLILIKIN